MSHIYDLKLSFTIANANDTTAKVIVRVMLFFLLDKLMHRKNASMRSIRLICGGRAIWRTSVPTTSKSLSAKLVKLSSLILCKDHIFERWD